MKQETEYVEDKSNPTFSFITCETGKERVVIEKLLSIKSVKEIHQTHGKYDLVVKLENMTELELRDLVHDEIQDMTVVHSVMNLTSASVA